MSGTTSTAADARSNEPSRSRQSHRVSIKDALQRFKTVLRRGSSQRNVNPEPALAVPEPEASNPAPSVVVPFSSGVPAVGSSTGFATGNSYVAPPAPNTLVVSRFAYTCSSTGPELLEVDSAAPGPAAAFPSITMYNRGVKSRERAKLLFAKYGLDPDELQWPSAAGNDGSDSTSERQRVEKKIRQRVRVQCSSCSAVFGKSKICPRCSHVRCRECTRSPARKPKARSETKGKGRATSTELLPDPTQPSAARPFPQAQDQTIGYARHERNVRSCHKCTSPFAPNSAQICLSCGHLRCSKCIKELVVPFSWPKDRVVRLDSPDPTQPQRLRVYRKPRTRIRWNCHQCETLFFEGERTCRQCHHERCETCVRTP
jgi:hypothetical protein